MAANIALAEPPHPSASIPVARWRAALAAERARLRDEFATRGDAPRLLRALARATDEVVVAAWVAA